MDHYVNRTFSQLLFWSVSEEQSCVFTWLSYSRWAMACVVLELYFFTLGIRILKYVNLFSKKRSVFFGLVMRV